MGLVDYGSDSEPEAPSPFKQKRPAGVIAPTAAPPANKKKLLPGLPQTFHPYAGKGPKDDPALHQGRKRSRPYVDGDFDAHIYIALKVPKQFHQALDSLLERTRQLCPGVALHSFLDPTPTGSSSTSGMVIERLLHVSLAHPFPLRRSQIVPFKVDIQKSLLANVGSRISGFRLSLAGKVKIYYNGKKYGGEGSGGRAFIALRVAAGAKEINGIVDNVIHPVLRNLHRQLYHSDPQFHSSFAWCLTDAGSALDKSSIKKHEIGKSADYDRGQDDADLTTQSDAPPIGEEVVKFLDDEFEQLLLASQPAGGWVVESLILKIGKDISEMKLL